ncbi:membrane protein [Microbacterium phage Big4]|nr:membrane protein [Microbacterium phage Big4]
MEKPHGFIWHEPVRWEMGRMHFGRVSMSVSMIMALWGIPAFAMFLFGGIIGSSIHSAGGDPTIAGWVMLVGIVMLGLGIAVALLVGLIKLVQWIGNDIRVDGPRR